MAASHLSNDDFLLRLTELFESRRSKDHGSVFLTQKRLSSTGGGDAAMTSESEDTSDLNLANPVPILIRATDGKSKEHRKEKIKLSTIVQPDALDGFFLRYAEVCKSGMSALKKRDRSGRKKAKAKKRKAGGEGQGKE